MGGSSSDDAPARRMTYARSGTARLDSSASWPPLAPAPSARRRRPRRPHPNAAPRADVAALRAACRSAATSRRSSRARPRRPPGCSTPTARFLYLLDPETGVLQFTHSAGIVELAPGPPDADAPAPGRGRACSARRSRTGGSWSPATTWPTTGSSTPTGDRPFVDEIGIRSMVVAPLTAGDEVFGALGTFSRTVGRLHRAPDRARPRALGPRGVRDGQRPPDRGARRARARRSSARPPSSARCASSAPGSPAPATRARSSSTRSTRRSGCSTATARGSTSSTPRSACCAACTRRARSRSSRPSGRAIPSDRLEVGASGRAVDDRPDVHQPRLPDRRAARPRPRARHLRRATRASTASSPRRCSATRARSGRSRCGRRRRTRSAPERRRPARDDRRPVGGRARPRAADRGAGPVARDARPAGRGGARAARDRLAAGRDGRRPGRHPPPDRPRGRAPPGRRACPARPPRAAVGLVALDLPARDAVQRPDRGGRARRRRRRTAGRPASRASRSGKGGRSRRATTCATSGSPHYTEGDEGVTEVGLHSIIATPVVGEEGLLGVLQAGAPREARVRRGRHAAHRRARLAGDDRASPTPASSTGSRRRRRPSAGPRSRSARCARSPAG